MNYQQMQARKIVVDKFIAENDMPALKAQLDAYNTWVGDRISYHISEIPPEFAHIDNNFREAVYMWMWQHGEIKPEELTVYKGDCWLYSWTGYPIGNWESSAIPRSEGEKMFDADEDKMDMDCAHGVGHSYYEHKAELYPTIAFSSRSSHTGKIAPLYRITISLYAPNI